MADQTITEYLELDKINDKTSIDIVLLNNDTQEHEKIVTLNKDYLTLILLKRIILREFSLISSNGCRVFNFYGIEILDDSDLIFKTDNDKLFYFSYSNKTDNKYLLRFFKNEKKLGEGGFGKVYLAKQIFSNKHYALKYISFKKSKFFIKNMDLLQITFYIRKLKL